MSDVLYSEHPAMFKNNPLGFIGCILLIAAFGLGLLILLWWYLHCRSSTLTITSKEIRYEKGLLSKSRVEFGIASVRTVKVNQSFFDRIFGVGAIQIYTSGDQPEIQVKGMPDPNRIRELIN